jgi:hypothetical protein
MARMYGGPGITVKEPRRKKPLFATKFLAPLDLAPACERPPERDLVGVLEVAADRKAAG